MNTYKFYYPDLNVRQTKILIPHSAYLTYKEMPYGSEDEIIAAKEYLKLFTHGYEWFTDRSPLYDSIKSGKLIVNGGSYNCIVTKK